MLRYSQSVRQLPLRPDIFGRHLNDVNWSDAVRQLCDGYDPETITQRDLSANHKQTFIQVPFSGPGREAASNSASCLKLKPLA
jgi:hypothetical protein